MSILVVERIIIPLLTGEYRRIALFDEELKRYIFEEFLERYNLIGSMDACRDLERLLTHLDEDEIRSVAEDIIKRYLRKYKRRGRYLTLLEFEDEEERAKTAAAVA